MYEREKKIVATIYYRPHRSSPTLSDTHTHADGVVFRRRVPDGVIGVYGAVNIVVIAVVCGGSGDVGVGVVIARVLAVFVRNVGVDDANRRRKLGQAGGNEAHSAAVSRQHRRSHDEAKCR